MRVPSPGHEGHHQLEPPPPPLNPPPPPKPPKPPPPNPPPPKPPPNPPPPQPPRRWPPPIGKGRKIGMQPPQPPRRRPLPPIEPNTNIRITKIQTSVTRLIPRPRISRPYESGMRRTGVCTTSDVSSAKPNSPANSSATRDV